MQSLRCVHCFYFSAVFLAKVAQRQAQKEVAAVNETLRYSCDFFVHVFQWYGHALREDFVFSLV